MEYYYRYIKDVYRALSKTLVTTEDRQAIPIEDGLRRWCELTLCIQESQNTLYLVGNGASASMASHMAADFSKNCDCRSMAFNDIALMTAVSNDISYEQCFATPLKRFARKRDMLVTISSSGKSPNILEVIKAAKDLNLAVVTLSGMDPDNPSRHLGDLNFYVPADSFGLVEACHQTLLHCWLDTFLENRTYQAIPVAVLQNREPLS